MNKYIDLLNSMVPCDWIYDEEMEEYHCKHELNVNIRWIIHVFNSDEIGHDTEIVQKHTAFQYCSLLMTTTGQYCRYHNCHQQEPCYQEGCIHCDVAWLKPIHH